MREIGNGQSVRPYVQFFRKTGYVFQNQRNVSPRAKTPKEMPFIFLRYLIKISRYEEKSEMVTLYGGNFAFSRQTG